MTKAELIDKIHDDKTINDAAVSKKNVSAIVELVFDLISKSLKAEGRFSYPGFGTFNKKERKERTGINPKTKEQIKIPATTTVTFKPASRFKDDLKAEVKKPAAAAAAKPAAKPAAAAKAAPAAKAAAPAKKK